MSTVLDAHGLAKRYRRGDGRWALRDVDVRVNAGEIVAVIGRNGAGKSTLLKLACGVSEPTAGTLTRAPRVAPLIEVGAGFHPELSGRDNVGVNGRLLGMSGREIKRAFDDIVDFAELGRVIDRPVKEYSSGMYMRLGFAVAVHTHPDLLLVDEVLSVGDLPFQVKCLDRIRLMREQGVGILFVSHNLAAVADIAASAILLDSGHMVSTGPPNEVIAAYHKALDARVITGDGAHHDPDAALRVLEVSMVDGTDGHEPPVWSPSQRAELRVRMRAEMDTPAALFGVQVNSEAIGLCQRWHPQSNALPPMRAGDVIDVRVQLSLALGPGGYSIDIAVASSDWARHLMTKPAALQFAVAARSASRGSVDLDPAFSAMVIADPSLDDPSLLGASA